jgi:hypothetical protein
MYQLFDSGKIVRRIHDNSFIPVDETNSDYLAYLSWLEEGNEPEPAEPPPPADPKLVGVEFEGVMCSATRDDQNGLVAVLVAYQLLKTAFQPTAFSFVNGNTLVLSLQNIEQFMAVWIPFRQSFFIPEPA